MDELPEDARQLLDDARDATSPTASDRARVWTSLERTMAADAPPSVGASTGGVGGLAISAGVAVVILAIAAGVMLTRPSEVAAPPRATPPTADTTERVQPAAPAPSPERAPSPTAAPTEQAPAPEAVAPRERPSPASRAGGDDIAADVTLLHEAQSAWRAGRASDALRLAEQHRATFPRSALGKERDAIRVLALCALGRTQSAKRIATRLLANAGASPWRQAVLESCAGR